MRLVASSEPDAVSNFEALELINERLVLANAVCAELEACEGSYASDLPATALGLLRRWVAAHYEADVTTHPKDGLDQMIVPPSAEERMVDLRVATAVCEDLAMLWTADLRSEFVSDSNHITESLNIWRSRRPDPMSWQRPLPGGPTISLPSDRHRLSPTELAYKKKQSSVRQADRWNEMLADHSTYGPRSGYLVGVADKPVSGEWPLVWVRRVYS